MPAVAVVGAAVVGGMIASRSQSRSASKAAAASDRAAQLQSETTLKMYDQTREDLKIYRDIGAANLEKLNTFDTNRGLDQYRNELAATQRNIDAISKFNFSATDKYMRQIEGMKLDFKFDSNDPIYKWRQSENERQVNQFFASRGGYDSRAAANMLLSSGMELQSQEVDKQYGRYLDRYNAKFQQLNVLAGMASEKEGNQYNKLIDVANFQTNKAATGFNQQQSVNNAEIARLNALSNIGQSAAGQTVNANQLAGNQLVNVSQINSNNQQNAILQRGAAQAQMWNTIGQAPANYLAAQALLK